MKQDLILSSDIEDGLDHIMELDILEYEGFKGQVLGKAPNVGVEPENGAIRDLNSSFGIHSSKEFTVEAMKSAPFYVNFGY